VISYLKKIVMSNELLNHLKNVNNNSLIGFCIQQILLREKELQERLQELKNISKENPEIMISIIGREAYSLLIR
jgi:hypothetical protein